MVKIKGNSVRFVFDKYNTNGQLSLFLENLNGKLDWKGVVKKIKGEFGVFIIKKKTKGKWGELYSHYVDEDLTLSDIGEKVQETLLSVQTEEDEEIKEEDNEDEKEETLEKNQYGELTNELVEVMYENKKIPEKISRRKSRAHSLVKNFKNIMSKYGNQSRKQLSRKDISNKDSNRRIGEKTNSEMESFLQAENKAFREKTNQTLQIEIEKSKFGCKSSDQIEKMNKSRSISKSKTGNIRLSILKTRNSSGKKILGDKNKEEEKTGLISQRRGKNDSKINRVNNTGDFKVLTIDDLMSREQHTFTKKNINKISKRKPNLNKLKGIQSDTFLGVKKNPFRRISKNKNVSLSPLQLPNKEQIDTFENELQNHKDKFSSKNVIANRRSIYHQQMSRNHLDNLKKSRKSIRGVGFITKDYYQVNKSKNKKNNPPKLEHSPSILEELNIEFSNEFPIIQNSSIIKSKQNNRLPIKKQITSKSHKIIKPYQKLRQNKSNPRYRLAANKRLRNIEKSFKPKSVSKNKNLRSRSKPYLNKKKTKKGSSVVFTKPKTNKRRIKNNGKSKSAVHNRVKKNIKTAKKEPQNNSLNELNNIFYRVKGKKQEILDTFAGLSLDMGWVHKQCRNMNLESSDGVMKFLEMQNRLIIKLASKLRKEKNSRYIVEKQCQKMMEKFSNKLT